MHMSEGDAADAVKRSQLPFKLLRPRLRDNGFGRIARNARRPRLKLGAGGEAGVGGCSAAIGR